MSYILVTVNKSYEKTKTNGKCIPHTNISCSSVPHSFIIVQNYPQIQSELPQIPTKPPNGDESTTENSPQQMPSCFNSHYKLHHPAQFFKERV